MRQQLAKLLSQQKFDSLVCDFLFPAPNIPELGRAVLFQHNVESIIWRRHAEEAKQAAKKAYFRLQARRMEKFERDVCRRAGHIVAVSEVDRAAMRELFGVQRISPIATGVDIDYFAPPARRETKSDLIFIGSMDWLPNIDAIEYFAADILPLIQKERPECRVIVAGRRPTPALQELARREPRIVLTGTVPDVRPFLWESTVSIVPLRIGGGTRLKIFEAVAARLPVVSTSVGAEGLPLENGTQIAIADTPEAFAAACLRLLANVPVREQMSQTAWDFVASRFSWEAVTRDFEAALEAGPRPN
jgi:glycosyltransferase involved in cell wall biosynthesis